MKQRLDILLIANGLCKSRSQAVDLIKRGEVIVDGVVLTKPSIGVSPSAIIVISNPVKYVGRGGLKLEQALTHWHIDVTDKIAIDIGSSTGGFTDCLLQNNIAKVYAVDVGTDQLDITLRNNPKVIVFEQTDIRNLILSEKIDIAVMDVSFISITKLFSYIKNLLNSNGTLVALIKPQFEVGKDYINKQGLVKTNDVRQTAIKNVRESAIESGFVIHDIIDSPITGGSGNKEFLLYSTIAQ